VALGLAKCCACSGPPRKRLTSSIERVHAATDSRVQLLGLWRAPAAQRDVDSRRRPLEHRAHLNVGGSDADMLY
jgi:hypothetical protein